SSAEALLGARSGAGGGARLVDGAAGSERRLSAMRRVSRLAAYIPRLRRSAARTATPQPDPKEASSSRRLAAPPPRPPTTEAAPRQRGAPLPNGEPPPGPRRRNAPAQGGDLLQVSLEDGRARPDGGRHAQPRVRLEHHGGAAEGRPGEEHRLRWIVERPAEH